MPQWDPDLYLKFAAERTRPAIDLAARVAVAAPGRVIDLGCGPGNSTAVLRARWPEAEITGLDLDLEMLAAAVKSDPGVHWIRGDAGSWPESFGRSREAGVAPAAFEPTYDVVFSNAMLQWLPDHAAALVRWFTAVSPGGALAVQVPSHLESPLHRQILELSCEPEWQEATAPARSALVTHDVGYYYDLLSTLTARLDLWLTDYCHVMDGAKSIVRWIRGTGLRPFLAALPDDASRCRFEAALLARLETTYPRRPDGRVLFPFRRLFFVAYREG